MTLAHIQAFIEARRILLAAQGVPRPKRLEEFGGALGFISLNGDAYVSQKLASKGQRALTYEQWSHLVDLAIEAYPWMRREVTKGIIHKELRERWPALKFIHVRINGADDVVKHGKYAWSSIRQRFITMGRPGYTQAVVRGMLEAGVDPEAGYFIMGPELEDVSSTAVREALVRGDMLALNGLLEKRVAEWCFDHYRQQQDEETPALAAETQPESDPRKRHRHQREMHNTREYAWSSIP